MIVNTVVVEQSSASAIPIPATLSSPPRCPIPGSSHPRPRRGGRVESATGTRDPGPPEGALTAGREPGRINVIPRAPGCGGARGVNTCPHRGEAVVPPGLRERDRRSAVNAAVTVDRSAGRPTWTRHRTTCPRQSALVAATSPAADPRLCKMPSTATRPVQQRSVKDQTGPAEATSPRHRCRSALVGWERGSGVGGCAVCRGPRTHRSESGGAHRRSRRRSACSTTHSPRPARSARS